MFPERSFKNFNGILHTDGYVGYEKDVGAEGMKHACCIAYSRRKFIEAIKVQTKAHAADAKLERVVALMDELFAIDREAREQKLSLEDRHALRQERVPAILTELQALLLAMQASGAILPKSIAGNAISYTLKRWEKLTLFMKHPVIKLSTNWAENSMRPISIGRRNWLHLGSKEAGPKIAAIFSIAESCRRLGVPIRKYLLNVLPGWPTAPSNLWTNSPLPPTPSRWQSSPPTTVCNRQPMGLPERLPSIRDKSRHALAQPNAKSISSPCTALPACTAPPSSTIIRSM